VSAERAVEALTRAHLLCTTVISDALGRAEMQPEVLGSVFRRRARQARIAGRARETNDRGSALGRRVRAHEDLVKHERKKTARLSVRWPDDPGTSALMDMTPLWTRRVVDLQQWRVHNGGGGSGAIVRARGVGPFDGPTPARAVFGPIVMARSGDARSSWDRVASPTWVSHVGSIVWRRQLGALVVHPSLRADSGRDPVAACRAASLPPSCRPIRPLIDGLEDRPGESSPNTLADSELEAAYRSLAVGRPGRRMIDLERAG